MIRLHFDKGLEHRRKHRRKDTVKELKDSLDKQVVHLIGTVKGGRNHNPKDLKFEQMTSR